MTDTLAEEKDHWKEQWDTERQRAEKMAHALRRIQWLVNDRDHRAPEIRESEERFMAAIAFQVKEAGK